MIPGSLPAGFNLCADVTFRPWQAGILATNHRARHHVWMNLPLFAMLCGQPDGKSLEAADQTVFGNVDGLLADPSNLREEPGQKTVFASGDEALRFLCDRWIVLVEETNYRGYFGKRTSLVDRKHFGTFHQQLGTELRLRHRVNPDKWWYSQKFDPSTGQLRDTLYKYVQQPFLENTIGSLDLENRTVLDFGCGSGMASELFIRRGARVIGVDPDPALLGVASGRLGSAFTPLHLPLEAKDPFSVIPAESVDLVWIADVFLFYFYPQSGEASKWEPGQVLRRLTSRLVANGRCFIMQPHGVFWLAPWLGDADAPYTVLTEYANRLYSVTPSLEELSTAIAAAGLCIRRIHEPKPVKEAGAMDGRAYTFATEFPVWWAFDCARVEN